MAHNPITIDLLRALDEIDQRGSFAAAAQALFKVPSALTYTIQKFEQDLDIELFDRSGHRAKLTQAGKLILDEGRLILRDIDSLATSAKKIAGGWEPQITICIDAIYSLTALYPLIKRFNELHPYIKINLTQGSLSGPWEMLLNQKADLIATSDGLDPKLEGYQRRLIGTLESVFVVSKDHPLAEFACDVTEALIDKYPVVVVPDSAGLTHPLTVGWTRQNKVITVPTMAEKITAQKAGLGVGYLPTHRIQHELDTGELVPLKIGSTAWKAQLSWRNGTPGPALQWFLDEITGSDLGL